MKNAVVTASAVSVRTGRSSSHAKLGELKRGDSVIVLDSTLNRDYVKIVWIAGYAYSKNGKYIAWSGSPSDSPNAVVKANAISVRKGRAQSFVRLGKYQKGDKITVLDDKLDQTYAKVMWKAGYAYSKNGAYIRFEEEGGALPSAPNAEVTASAISVRKGRSLSYVKLGEFKRGDKIIVLDDKLDQTYAHVVWNGGDGYAYSKNGAYIRFLGSQPETPDVTPEDEPDIEKLPTEPNAEVTGSAISVRKGRSLSYVKLGEFKRGDRIIVLDDKLDQTYAHVVWNGGDGYAYSKNGAYIRFLNTAPAVPVDEAIRKTVSIAASCVGGKYIFGAQGTKITESFVRRQYSRYPEYFSNGRLDYLLAIGKRCDAAGSWSFPADYAWDCSGLWWYAANKAGIYGRSFDSTAHTFYHTYCTPISKAELRAGDAVFYQNDSGRITHMAVVGENGAVYEAMSGYTGVIKGSSVDDRKAPRIVGSGYLKGHVWNKFGRPKIFQ